MRLWVRRAARLRAAVLPVVAAIACSAAVASRQPRAAEAARAPHSYASRTVRIALAQHQPVVHVSSAGSWRIYSADGGTEAALTEPGERWILEREGSRVSARREDSHPVSHRDSPLIIRSNDRDGTILFNGRRWRGELLVSSTDAGLLVVNRVGIDDYVKGVVPLEIGTGAPADLAAVEAQAVAARSYAVTHLAGGSRSFDMVATVGDQVYGGATAENTVGNQAVDATAGLVLRYDGRVVNAPYHANCGGSTAEPEDVWRTSAEPYLQRVSDQIPGTTRFYCDQAPRFRWTRTFGERDLRDAVDRYVAKLSNGGNVGRVRDVRVAAVTPAGRVATLAIETDRRTLSLRGNEMREALRSPSGELLYSTYFSVDAVQGAGVVEQLTLRGGGNGHGVGMCQSGAIGRARAGQDFQTILRTYYPGTTVGALD